MKHSMCVRLFTFAAASVFSIAGALAHSEDEHAGPAYGKPGDPKNVTRTVTLIATEMRYSESNLTLQVGDTIRFVLINNGKKDHELMIADHAEQIEHRRMMDGDFDVSAMDHHMSGNVIDTRPGETKELIWTFTQPGSFDFACNYAGHAEGGMAGKIVVRAAPGHEEGASGAHEMPGDHPANSGAGTAEAHEKADEHPTDHGAAASHAQEEMPDEQPMGHGTETPETSAMPRQAAMQMTHMTGALGPYPMTREASGTSWQPDSTKHMMGMEMRGEWMVMGHVRLNAVYDWQEGPRGDEKAFISGMIMGSARRDLQNGVLNLRAMFSPDPFSGKRGYPLLLAAGETADGVTPLIDRQHPHELVMELSASYSHRLGEGQSVFVYAGLPGEPAFGPPAFMHRVSTMDSPEAPITHHWLDSTHITFGVLTAGYVQGPWKVELSRFKGREPDEDRYDIEEPKLDSTAIRASWNPSERWALQVSWADFNSPEQLEPDVDETRLSASAIYTVPLADESSWSTTIAWGLKDPSDEESMHAFALETAYAPGRDWTFFARGEVVESHDLLPSGDVETVGKISFGAIRDFHVMENVRIGIGALYSVNFVSDALEPSYDGDPDGAMVFLRLVAGT